MDTPHINALVWAVLTHRKALACLSQALPGSVFTGNHGNHASDPATFTGVVLLIPALYLLGFSQFPHHVKKERWVSSRLRTPW